jgi:hypothetical protein
MNYERIYNQIIERAKSENRQKNGSTYYEAHHIIPKCLGGKGQTKDLNHPNIVLLTAKEHYIAHRLLCEIYPKSNKLRFASWCMINGLGTNKRHSTSSRIYESLRQSLKHSDDTKEKMSLAKKGKPGHATSEETKKKIIEARRGYVHDDITRKKMSESGKKRRASKETRQKMSLSHKGKVLSDETRKRMSKPKSEQHRKNMIGRIISPETRNKLSEAAKNRELIKRLNKTN